jgi:ABC-type lipoprotein export system ATPase subunit
MAIAIKAENLHKTYWLRKKEVEVLKGASFSINNGEKTAIVGMSGAGKSTLLHILGGLDKPAQGRVLVHDRDVYALTGSQRTKLRASEIGFVFQSYNLLDEMDVLENVMIPAMARSAWYASSREMREQAMRLLESVGLQSRAHHTPLELSGGEQQRVAIARALMNNPSILLADEPTGNLDDVTGRQVLDLLFSLCGGPGHSLVIVTHNDQVANACDKVLVLRKGILEKK